MDEDFVVQSDSTPYADASPVKKVSFLTPNRRISKERMASLAKSRSVIPIPSEEPVAFRPTFASLKTKFLSFPKALGTGKKSWIKKKRASNFSMLSTNPSFYHSIQGQLFESDEDALYADNAQNKVEVKANLIKHTKLRTLKALAGILQNRKSVPGDSLKKVRGHNSLKTYEDVGVTTAQVHVDSYDTVVKLIKDTTPTYSKKRKQIKVMVDLPKLPFGKHVAYNSVQNFKQRHVVNFEPSAQLLDKITNEIWIKKLERRRQTEPEMPVVPPKKSVSVDFQTEELQLFNSKLKVAEENLYMHYSTGSKFWKRDLMEKQAGWRGLYRLELKRQSELNVTSDL